ncbi:hypothetical protein [Alkaliphilus transvaalensis]|uniref:hypothetical protein n=1 Tax=Alkaliphilus transvaalensis TaxID=114628 RepID=UPI00047DC0BE|nr:hypothetical protein [Alkaliphilus transvaalensis]
MEFFALTIALFFGIGFLALIIWSIVWAYGDAEARGKSGCLVALLVFFVSWPVGLIIWLIFRPDQKKY